VALKLLLSTGRNDKVSYLWGQETSKPTHTLYLIDLISDALFQMLV
jgi:hypothetical protein